MSVSVTKSNLSLVQSAGNGIGVVKSNLSLVQTAGNGIGVTKSNLYIVTFDLPVVSLFISAINTPCFTPGIAIGGFPLYIEN